MALRDSFFLSPLVLGVLDTVAPKLCKGRRPEVQAQLSTFFKA